MSQLHEIFKQRSELLKAHGYESYEAYLQSEEWRTIKQAVRARKGAKWNCCNICGVLDNLDLHHSSYKVIGTTNPANTVKLLCRSCHGDLHELCKTSDLDFYQAFKEVRRLRTVQRLPVFHFPQRS